MSLGREGKSKSLTTHSVASLMEPLRHHLTRKFQSLLHELIWQWGGQVLRSVWGVGNPTESQRVSFLARSSNRVALHPQTPPKKSKKIQKGHELTFTCTLFFLNFSPRLNTAVLGPFVHPTLQTQKSHRLLRRHFRHFLPKLLQSPVQGFLGPAAAEAYFFWFLSAKKFQRPGSLCAFNQRNGLGFGTT